MDSTEQNTPGSSYSFAVNLLLSTLTKCDFTIFLPMCVAQSFNAAPRLEHLICVPIYDLCIFCSSVRNADYVNLSVHVL